MENNCPHKNRIPYDMACRDVKIGKPTLHGRMSYERCQDCGESLNMKRYDMKPFDAPMMGAR